MLADVVDEGRRVGQAGIDAGLPLRVMGGVGVALCCPSAGHEELRRPYSDLDVVGRRRDAKRISAFLVDMGYRPDHEFNALQGSDRMLFWDDDHSRQLDVFLDALEMCHRIELSKRLQGPGPALAPADLLLCKLQVVEINRKDLVDIAALLSDHSFDEGAEAEYVASLTAADWGLWRTATYGLQRAAEFVAARPSLARARENVEALGRRIEAAPKSRGWRVRARIGERMRWYELPEDKA